MNHVARWLDGRSARERRVLGVAGALAATSLLIAGAVFVRDDLRAAAERVAGHERELAQVRRLAAVVVQARANAPVTPAADAPSLPSLLEAATGEVVGRDRIASMTPTESPDGESRVSLRIAGASLEEAVRLVHALESAPGSLVIGRLGLEKHVDDVRRFDVVLEVRAPGAASSSQEPAASPKPSNDTP